MLNKLEAIKERWEEVGRMIVDPDVIANMPQYVRLNKEYKDLEAIVNAYETYKNVLANIDSSNEILATEKDEEFREMAKMELDELGRKKIDLEEEIKVLLIPKDPEDGKNAVVEIRAGTGGDEASIFAGDLYRMYTRYCESKGWKTELVDFTDGTSGGFKEVVFNVNGEDVYGELKYEAGVHRVQ
ncbi:MAG: PCRF domain-containing protein, partial [Bacteroidota bacterium]